MPEWAFKIRIDHYTHNNRITESHTGSPEHHWRATIPLARNIFSITNAHRLNLRKYLFYNTRSCKNLQIFERSKYPTESVNYSLSTEINSRSLLRYEFWCGAYSGADDIIIQAWQRNVRAWKASCHTSVIQNLRGKRYPLLLVTEAKEKH